jgi:site-specific DNA-cytosine methylase
MSHRAKRITALGNAVVPQCAAVIGRAILQADQEIKRGF